MRKLLLFLFSHRLLAIARWDLHFLRLRLRNTVTFQTRRICKFIATCAQPLYLNLGSGPRGLKDPHWVNVDGFPAPNVHFTLDFGRRLPFADATFDGIFCEHVIEHFSLEDGEALAREAWRVLRPGGCLRVVVPDAELVMRRYFDAPSELIAWRGEGTETVMETVNSCFRQRYEHQFLYDWAGMEKMLQRAGFASVTRASYGKSPCCPALALDDSKYEWESLYAEAIKP